MSNELNKIIMESIPNQKSANELLGRLFDITKPGAVYSAPVTAENATVITASEYMAGLGVGYGGGGGIEGGKEPGDETSNGMGSGGGGGGGGTAVSRPVAAIIIESGHVRVEPIMDVTKVSIAFITAFGAMWMAWSRMRRASR